MSGYYDYFEERIHSDGEVTLDEFIAEAMLLLYEAYRNGEELPFD